MRVLRLVLTLALAAAVFAEETAPANPVVANGAATANDVLGKVAESDIVQSNPDAANAMATATNIADALAPEGGDSALPGAKAAPTSDTPVLDQAIDTAATSDNAGVAIAGTIGQMAQNSGLISGKQINTFKAANPKLGAFIGAAKNTAEIAQGVNQCYASIEGSEAAIAGAFTSLGTSMVNSDTINGAMALGKASFAAAGKTSTQQDAIYQLFRIYLDQNANTGKALTTTQEKAYASLTPACNAAFDDIVTTYADSKGTVNSLLAGGNSNVTCDNYQDAATAVDMTLCVWPTAIWANEDKIYANLTATFTNYGVALCDVSFYIINLAGNVGLKPTWLPNSAKAFPDGIPKETEIALEASVPWSAEIANGAPVVDILKDWSACPNGRATPAPTAARTEKPKADSGVVNSASACFITPACQAAVAPYAADSCGAYAQLLTSGCSTCSKEVLASAQATCLATCSTQYCGAITDKQETTSGAGALSKAVAFMVTLVAAFFAL